MEISLYGKIANMPSNWPDLRTQFPLAIQAISLIADAGPFSLKDCIIVPK